MGDGATVSGLAFEDFSVGQVIDLGSYQVTEQEIIEFAQAYDPQPIHTDPEAATDSQFGGLISSGWLSCAIFMKLQCAVLLKNSSSVASPGVDDIRWMHPVRPGDTLSATNEVIEVRPSKSKPDRGFVRNFVSMVNQAGVEVMSLKTKNIFLRRRVSPG